MNYNVLGLYIENIMVGWIANLYLILCIVYECLKIYNYRVIIRFNKLNETVGLCHKGGYVN